jgi:hypothetical protein
MSTSLSLWVVPCPQWHICSSGGGWLYFIQADIRKQRMNCMEFHDGIYNCSQMGCADTFRHKTNELIKRTASWYRAPCLDILVRFQVDTNIKRVSRLAMTAHHCVLRHSVISAFSDAAKVPSPHVCCTPMAGSVMYNYPSSTIPRSLSILFFEKTKKQFLV